MALKLYDESDVETLADVTRALLGTSDTYTLHEIAEALYRYALQTNWLLEAVDSDGTPYNNGLGYKAGYRLNSAGQESALAGKYVTGFIPVSQYQKVILENMTVMVSSADNNYIAFYDSNFTLLSGCSRYAYAWYLQSGDAIKPATDDGNGHLSSFTVTGSTGTFNYPMTGVAYFRISCNLIDSTSAIYIE